MTIQPIGPASVALYLTPDDLRPHGITPHDITRALALELTRAAFRQAGLPAEGPLEIEAYPDPYGVLVFARGTQPAPLCFVFQNLEDLLCAARSLGDRLPPQAALYLHGDQLWLTLPGDAEQAACALSEFARPTGPDPLLAARLEEHGVPLIPSGVFQVLLRWFLA